MTKGKKGPNHGNISLRLILFILVFVIPCQTFSHPGNTASDGCHYCRTNCDSWGVPWYERHCHGGFYIPVSPNQKLSEKSCPETSLYFKGSLVGETHPDKKCQFLFAIRDAENIFEIIYSEPFLTVSKDSKTVVFKNRSDKARIFQNGISNEKNKHVKPYPRIIDGKFFVPVRFLFETFGFSVTYDGSGKIDVQ